MNKYILSGILILSLTCCKRSEHYFIDCCGDGANSVNHNGILFLTESANYQSLQFLRDSLALKNYLSEDEMRAAFDTTIRITALDTSVCFNSEFVPWDTLFMKDNFIAEMVLLKDNTDNRGYYFQIRTYDQDHKLISKQDFATWSDRKNLYCSGDFAVLDQTFIVTCGNSKTKYKFDNLGKIFSIE